MTSKGNHNMEIKIKRISLRLLVMIVSIMMTVCMGQSAFAEDGGTAVAGDFTITGDTSYYSFDEATGVLTITGDVEVSTSGETNQRIVIANDCTVTLGGVDIKASGGPAIRVDAGVSAALTLKDGTGNTVTGADNFAGIQSTYEDGNLATVTIDGKGTLNANGGRNSAGIGGSYSNKTTSGQNTASYSGNIIIKSGTINAQGGNGGAGIGSALNNGTDTDGTTHSASFKMKYNKLGDITISGGTIDATGGSQAAGIGGGSHTDTGMITITGNAHITAHGTGDSAGIGNGCGSSRLQNGEKGPGEYVAYVTIDSDDVYIEAYGDRNGAGIGGGMYCDGVISISGGEIHATGGHGDNGSYHHGGAGIGGGYVGHADVTITGGTITAEAGYQSGAAGIGSGGTANTNPSRGRYTGRISPDLELDQTTVKISGDAVINAVGGEYGGAGIGGGTGSDKIEVSITGGTVTAAGGKSNEENKLGGAGIGSGLRGDKATTGKDDYYFTDTDVDVSITGGTVIATGGWGASGIGSGANNKMAENITIDADNAQIQAYSDGTKFAIDTRVLNDDGSTTSQTEGRSYTGDLLQGTFVHKGEIGDYEQNPEGLGSIKIINDQTDETVELTLMPEGYRSFATNVSAPGVYTVYTDDSEIGRGEGRFFSKCSTDIYAEENISENNVQYTAVTGKLCDNFYLFPVKSVVVRKTVIADKEILSGITGTVRFGLKAKDDGQFIKKNDGSQWLEPIEIVDGVPQGKAYFVNIPDKTFDVIEVDENGVPLDADAAPIPFGSAELVRIRTNHAGAGDNNAIIDDDHWTDTVEVLNTYEAPADDPGNDEPAAPEKDEQPVAPKTGDNSGTGGYVMLMLTSAAGVALLLFARKRSA